MNMHGDVDSLWGQYKDTGDREVRDRLVAHYSPLVKFVAGRVRAGLPSSVEQDDLISDGVMGLLDAIDKFDPDRGLQFQTYAVPRVRGAIVDGLRSLDWVPRALREKMRDIDVATATLEHRLQRRPDDSEVAEELGISDGELRTSYSQSSYATLSIMASDLVGDEAGPRAIDGLPGDADAFPAGFLAALGELPERDQIVMALYYWERFSLAEIGLVLQVTESRISQVMSRATLELRRRIAT
jgi:RNA polymerase sigma factor FliA